jgi:ankyrin repeat protein
VERGTTALVDALIDAGVSVRDPEIGGRALVLAARDGNTDIVTRLMNARAPLGYSSWDGETPLHAAAARGQERVVDVLLRAGVDPDLADGTGQTALMKAAGSGHEAVVESLIRAGATVDRTDRDGWTALMHAAAHSSYGAAGAIRDLVRAGAGVEKRAGGNGKTPLMIAAEKGNEGAVDALVRAGARLDVKLNGKTALDLALAGGHKRCAEKLGYDTKEEKLKERDKDKAKPRS